MWYNISVKPSAIRNHERYLKAEARQRNKVALDVLREAVYLEMAPMVRAQIDKALEGDTKAFSELMDRTYGKPKENLDITGDVKFSISSLAEQWEEQQKQKDGLLA